MVRVSLLAPLSPYFSLLPGVGTYTGYPRQEPVLAAQGQLVHLTATGPPISRLRQGTSGTPHHSRGLRNNPVGPRFPIYQCNALFVNVTPARIYPQFGREVDRGVAHSEVVLVASID